MDNGKVSRREFTAVLPATCGAAALFGLTNTRAAAEDKSVRGTTPPAAAQRQTPATVAREFPAQSADQVRQIVGAAHVKLDRVTEMVTHRPALAKAAWDWGFGDWESALGAASHMGRRDIANVLIKQGARPNIFTFTTLGHVAAVEQIVTAMPGIQRLPGPHGITLLAHARNTVRQNDDDTARKMLAYVESLHGANENAINLDLEDKEKATYIGNYKFGEGSNDSLEVLTARDGQLSIRRGKAVLRRLNRVGEHAFAPCGAPEVRIHFDVVDGAAKVLTVHDPAPLVKALR